MAVQRATPDQHPKVGVCPTLGLRAKPIRSSFELGPGFAPGVETPPACRKADQSMEYE